MDLLSIDLATVFTFLAEKALSYIGPDERRSEFRERLLQRIRLSTEEASWVQCIGMPKPIPITRIYQPSRFVQEEDGGSYDLEFLLGSSRNSIIFAGPGMGKSTLLNRVYVGLAKSQYSLPLLFTLRSLKALEDLRYLIQNLGQVKRWEAETRKEVERLQELSFKLRGDSEHESGGYQKALNEKLIEVESQRKKLEGLLGRTGSIRIVLLVDGYDEVSENERLSVSDLLMMYSSLDCGPYILTCRSFYDVYSLKANHYFLAPFSREDAERFVMAFMENYGKQVDAKGFIDDLAARGFGDFTSHPLMLTLVCVLKTGRMSNLPKNSISLIRRALEILTFRWDEEKGVHRDSEYSLDGEDRLRCLMRIAYFMELDQATDAEVEKIVESHLRLLQIEDVNPAKLIREITQWFGIIYQNSAFNWRFAHKVIHDYLAARFWVESASFSPPQVRLWNARAGYAACLVPDATQSLVYALRFSKDITAFVEALSNNPLFEPRQVALVVLEHFSKYPEFLYKMDGNEISLRTWQDFFSLASDPFLSALLSVAITSEGRAAELLIGYAGSELLRRGRAIDEESAKVLPLKFKNYDNLIFIVRRTMATHKFMLQDLLDSVSMADDVKVSRKDVTLNG